MSKPDNELLLLCHSLNMEKHSIGGMLYSEKLDGMRAFWDGGLTIGMMVKDVPWSNKYDARKQTMRSTGFWSRLGNVIHVPALWASGFPKVFLDGELFAGYNHRQFLMSIIKQESPVMKDWMKVDYMVYDSPPVARFLKDRKVTYTGRKQTITFDPKSEWPNRVIDNCAGGYASRYKWLTQQWQYGLPMRLKLHEHKTLPMQTSAAKTELEQALAAVLAKNGEGLVLRTPHGPYECARSHHALKYKPFDDATGTVVGFVAGEETDKGSRLLGKMGSLIILTDDKKTFQLSGFTDEERLLDPTASAWAMSNPGVSSSGVTLCSKPVPAFAFGSRIDYKYRGLTADGLPMEARYWRQRGEE